MKSMTGFGRGTSSGENYAASIELKTVNNRFLDVHLRLASELQSLEAVLKRQISSRLSRGRVDVTLSLERTSEIAYELNRPLIAGYLQALSQLRQEFSLSGEPDLNVIARLPGVLQTAKDELDTETQSGIEAALELALTELEQMREIEGEALKIEMFSRLTEIARQIAVIEPNAASITENYRARLQKKITDLLAKSDSQIELDQARLAQEVAYLAERSDIAEEITRLKAHIEQFRAIMEE